MSCSVLFLLLKFVVLLLSAVVAKLHVENCCVSESISSFVNSEARTPFVLQTR